MRLSGSGLAGVVPRRGRRRSGRLSRRVSTNECPAGPLERQCVPCLKIPTWAYALRPIPTYGDSRSPSFRACRRAFRFLVIWRFQPCASCAASLALWQARTNPCTTRASSMPWLWTGASVPCRACWGGARMAGGVIASGVRGGGEHTIESESGRSPSHLGVARRRDEAWLFRRRHERLQDELQQLCRRRDQSVPGAHAFLRPWRHRRRSPIRLAQR